MTVFAVEDELAVPFLAMEFVEGESLQQKIEREGPLGFSEICRIGSQVASGLSAAHAQNLIHWDIKPAIILLEAETVRVQITDFGLARAVKEAGDTPLGMMSGTPQYMSPKQAERNPAMARHLTIADRDRIAELKHQGRRQNAIARVLQRSVSTICRELKRNSSGGKYRAGQAQQRAERHRRERPLLRKMDNPKIKAAVCRGLRQYWSPEQIDGR